jgi:DNA-binding MarR family transcriptional regulator
MSAPLESLVTVDRVIHEPARFAILTVLSACRKADFLMLQSVTGIAAGNLSGHLARLEQHGLITIQKGFKGKYPRTWVQITAKGTAAFKDHWERLDASRTKTRQWWPMLRRRALIG